MIASPLALLGLLAVAVPILIHLLGRHQSRIERFPTLRFIGTSRLSPTKRRRISDWPLLLVRIAIVAVAAIALSQPLFRQRLGDSTQLSRVIIVDTSASMPRAVGTLADSTTGDVVTTQILTDSPSDAIEGAVAWLETRPGRREIMIVSDFQKSSIDQPYVPEGIGLSFAQGLSSSSELPAKKGYSATRLSAQPGPSDLSGATAAWRAIGLPLPSDSAARVAIIYRGYPGADSLLRSAAPVDSSWMARIVAAVQLDPTFQATQPNHIEAKRLGGQLALFVGDDAGSLASAALNQALVRAMSSSIPASELDTTHWSSADLARWKRDAQASPGQSSDESDGRWLWAVSLALIALETWMRSHRAVIPSEARDLHVEHRKSAA